MKNRLIFPFFLFALLSGSSLFGQIEKGTYLLGGTGTIGLDLYDGDNDFNIALYPRGGLFLTDQLAVGTGLGLGYAGDGFFFISPFVRYYPNPTAEKWKLFGTAGLGYQNQFTGDGAGIFSLNAGVGSSIFLNSNIAVEPVLTYNYFKPEDIDGQSLVGLMVGLQFFLPPSEQGEFSSQTNLLGKGNWLIGGGGSIRLNFANDNTTFNLDAFPGAGTFITDQVVVGARLLFGYRDSGDLDFTRTSIGLAPFARYYFDADAGLYKLFAFVRPGFSYVSGKGLFGEKYDDSDFEFAGGVGVDYFLTPSVALEATAGFRVGNDFVGDNYTRLGIDFGFQYFLDCSKE